MFIYLFKECPTFFLNFQPSVLASILHKLKCKTPLHKNSLDLLPIIEYSIKKLGQNPTMYNKNYIPWLREICSKYIRLVQHLTINQYNPTYKKAKEEKSFNYINWYRQIINSNKKRKINTTEIWFYEIMNGINEHIDKEKNEKAQISKIRNKREFISTDLLIP